MATGFWREAHYLKKAEGKGGGGGGGGWIGAGGWIGESRFRGATEHVATRVQRPEKGAGDEDCKILIKTRQQFAHMEITAVNLIGRSTLGKTALFVCQ